DVTAMSTVYYAPNNGQRCVGCHTLTRDGTKMAVVFDGGNGPAGELDVTTKNLLIADTAGLYSNFAAYSPDARQMAVVSRGAITVIDAARGVTLKTVTDGSTVYATHPDWSPDGSALVYVQVAGPTGDDWHFTGGSIAMAKSDNMGGFMPP